MVKHRQKTISIEQMHDLHKIHIFRIDFSFLLSLYLFHYLEILGVCVYVRMRVQA